ncbi:SDR family oxidoreductase, partial [Oleiphilus sp. HI0066]|uniref:SDR family oxidoreductase n=5 Tax=Oleiphilus TaxID=141450 RepID=UPI000B0247A2
APLTQFASSIGGHAIALDLTTTDAVEELLGSITSQLGVIDIVVHNAGITRDKTLRNMRPEQWDSVLNLNLEKIIKINEALIEKKALAKNARIVGVSSISGIAGNFGQTNYACSKGGLAGYTQAMASSLSNGMTINAVAPGFIETRMTSKVPFVPREVGRRSNAFSQGGLPIDVAEVIAFMCQSASQAINGNVVRVCGQSLLGR